MSGKVIETSEKVCAEIVRMYLRAVPDVATMLRKCESPIEQLFLVSLFSACEESDGVYFGEYAVRKYEYSQSTFWGDVAPFDPESIVVCNGDGSFAVAQQHNVALDSKIIRLDFAAVTIGIVRDDTPRMITSSVAIELDGHEWHERTKEQAASDKARDRALVKQGWHVLRYSGHEVYADAGSCVRDAVETVARLTAERRRWFSSIGSPPKRMDPVLPRLAETAP